MNSTLRWWILGAVSAAVIAAPVASLAKDHSNSNSTLLLRPERAGWMLGMYVGEDKSKPYPYVLGLDDSSEAKTRGIKPGDELIRVDNQEPLGLKNLVDRVGRMHTGSDLDVWVRRGTQTLEFEMTVPKNPLAVGADKPAAKKKEAKKGDQASTDQDKKKKDRSIIFKPIPPDE